MYPPPSPVVYRRIEPHPGARTASIFFGIIGALLAALVVMLRTGSTAIAIGVAAMLFVLALYAAIWASRSVSRWLATFLFVLVVAATWWLAIQAITVWRAFSFTDGPADPADPAALAAAESKIEEFGASGSFRIELTEDEIEAVIQNGLSDADSPLARITIDIVDGSPHGTLGFVGGFKNGDIEVSGTVSAVLDAGAVKIELVDLDFGSMTVPGLAEGAIEDLVESVADLNTILAENRADVQSIVLSGDRLLVTGTQGSGELLTSADLLADLEAQAAAAGSTVEPPAERFGPGVVNGTSAPGSVFYVALGDSLAANVGVEQPRDGYVSRVHNQLQIRDDAEYGLWNFGIPGETSGTLIRSGQLDDAINFLESNEIAYVTIDIGANDLLGHLGSADCGESLDAPACQERIDATFEIYAENMTEIFDRLVVAASDATIVFVRAYNPFSLGFGAAISLEAQSDETLDLFNEVAARLAADRGILVADAFTPMQGTTAATTHMLDDPPDIHPFAIGYDIMAAAVVDALG